MKKSRKIILGLAVAAIFALSLLLSRMTSGGDGENMVPVTMLSYSHFLDKVHAHDIQKATVSVTYGGQIVIGLDGDNKAYESRAPMNSTISDVMVSEGVAVTELPPTTGESLVEQLRGALIQGGIMLAMILAMVLIFRIASGKGGLMSLGKSPARLYQPDGNSVRFSDVAGIDEIRSELQEVVDFLKAPDKYRRMGAEMPRGFLLEGPPGVGKTLAAKAIAGEANVPFYSVQASDFVEVFVGVGASRIRSMISTARKTAPCIIFMDEIDAVGKARGGIGGNDERENTINALLAAMDGFDGNSGIVFLAATNRISELDEALTRPGRFDRKITFSLPGFEGRRDILKVHIHRRDAPFAPSLDISRIARRTSGFSGADLANLVNQACLQAARRHGERITLADFEEAQDRLMIGLSSQAGRSALTRDELLRVARHEVGHALLATISPHCHPVHKISIIPRGSALGVVVTIPEEDRLNVTLPQLHDELAMIMAGLAAEIVTYGEKNISAGAAADIQAATLKARSMVMTWGMGRSVPLMAMVGSGSTSALAMSPGLARLVDDEVGNIIYDAMSNAKTAIMLHRAAFDDAVEALLECEEMSGDEFIDIIGPLRVAPSAEDPALQEKDGASFVDGIASSEVSGGDG